MPTFVKTVFLTLLLVTPLMFGAVYSWAIGVLEVVIIIISGVWLWHSHKQRESFPWRHYWGLISLIIFLAVTFVQLLPWPIFVSKFLAPENLAAWTRLRNLGFLSSDYLPLSLNTFGTAYEGLKFLSYCLAVWLAINLVRYGNKRRNFNFAYSFALVVCVAGAIISAVAIVQVGVGAQSIYGFWKPYHTGNFMGPYVNRNNFAGYLEMALPMGLALFGPLLISRQRHIDEIEHTQSDRQLALIYGVGSCVILMLIGLFLSLSRGGIISGTVAISAQIIFLLLLLSRRKIRSHFLLWGLIAVASIAIVITLIPRDKLSNRFKKLSTETITADARFQITMDTWKMSTHFPLFGSGLGSYERVFPRYKTWPQQGLIQHAHNDYLEFLAEMGWVGFLAFMTFLVWVVVRGLKSIIAALKLRDRCPGVVTSRVCLISGSLGGVLAIMLHSFVDFNLHIPANALLFFVLCGVTVSLSEAKI